MDSTANSAVSYEVPTTTNPLFLTKSKLYYGGGITTKSQSKEMIEYADTIFVGNILYRDLDAYLSTIPSSGD